MNGENFETLWQSALSDGRVGYYRNCRTVRINGTGPITNTGDTFENDLPVIRVVEYKKNDYAFKGFVPYKAEYHIKWRKTDKGQWDLYFPEVKYEKENGEQYTVIQEPPVEFLR